VLLDSVSCEFDFMVEFFGGTEGFDNIFGKAILRCPPTFLIWAWRAPEHLPSFGRPSFTAWRTSSRC
jgi:hypothetical protein